MSYPSLRIGAVALMMLVCAGRSSAQSFGVTPTLTVSSNRVAPAGLLTVTLTVTNSGSGTSVPIIAGIVDTYAAGVVQISTSGGLQVLGPGNCDLGDDCFAPFTGFHTSLADGGVAVLSLTLRVARPAGAVFTLTGAVAPDPIPAGGIKRTSVQITVAGSGVPSLAPSRLIEGALMPAGIDPFAANTVVFDPTNRLHVAAGADLLANVVATMTESGLPVGNPFPVAFAPGVMPQPSVADIDVAYSGDLAATAPNGGVMAAWSEAVQIRTQTLSGLTIGLPRNYVGNGRSPRIVYSPTSREFLVVWVDFVSDWRLWARRVGLDGQPVGSIIDLTDASESQAHQFDLTWNPITNEYAVFYVHFTPLPRLRRSVEFARIGADGTILTKTQVTPAVRAEQLSAAVNSRTGEYILLWWDIDGTFAAEVNASGRVVSLGSIADSSFFAGEYASLAFNPASGTFLTTGSGGSRLRLRELNQYGAPLSAPTLSAQLIDGVISSPPAVSDWRVFGHFSPPNNATAFNFASETIGTLSASGGSETRLGGCVTPDPFVAFGGSVCFDGGWLPPGVPAPGTTITYVGGCSTPDPFLALGGGRCVDGGWFPPSAPSPTPTPTPTPTSGGCATPDPFVALGGGTCVNGGWYPPGMGAPVPTPPPPPVPGGCITPDPFVALGEGTCVNGGWYPPGMDAPMATPPPPPVPGGCITPDPFVALGGGRCINGGWYPPGMDSSVTAR
jgi:hypothetical protein